MPVSFLSPAQRDSYGQYLGDPSTQELARYFHLDDSDHTQIVEKRGDANRLGFALQLTTVRFVGTFLDDPTAVPPAVLATMSRQLGIDTTTDLTGYRDGKWRFAHAAQIRTEHGYRDLADRAAGFGLTRWLYAQCWTGTERRTLGYSPRPEPILAALSDELDQTYRAVAARLPNNPAVRFERIDGKDELIVSPLDKVEEPAALVALRTAIAGRLPRVDLPEILLEIAARTDFAVAFTHVSERAARVTDLGVSVCAVLLAEACNTGLEPLVRHETQSLRRDRLSWVSQNYLRDETLRAANARLVAAQTGIPLARAWGGGEVASADGLRFVVPVRTVHAGPNPKYFGIGRGVTYYNLVSDQFTGLHGITVPGTLRDSLVLLAVALEQQTELQPTQIMTDTGAYSDVVFGLFRLLGYRFSPRLADIGGTRFWRIDSRADYGPLNRVARQSVNLDRITPQWDDMLRTVGSLKLGRVPATGIMRTLQVGDRPTRLAQAFAEFGRIDKTIHTLTYLDDEAKRRATLIQTEPGRRSPCLGPRRLPRQTWRTAATLP